MELLNPRITIQNTDQPYWLVTLEQRLNEDESMTLTMRVNRTDSLAFAQAALIRRAQDMLAKMYEALTTAPQ